MSDLVLVIGNRNYSSWSLRGWLALEQSGLPFREEILWLDEDRRRERRRAVGPTGKVPVLRHGDVVISDGALKVIEGSQIEIINNRSEA